MTPSKANGCVVVPWDSLRDVKLDAWYRGKVHKQYMWVKIIRVNAQSGNGTVLFTDGTPLAVEALHDYYEYCDHIDGPVREWLPCTKVVPEDGSMHHEDGLK